MKDSELIILTGEGFITNAAAAATKLKADLLKLGASVMTIITVEQRNEAREDVLRRLADYRIKLEKARKEAKSPLTELGKKIDAIAAELGDEVLRMEKSVSGKIADYDAAAERERQRLEQERRDAERKAEQLRLDQERAEREAEAARLKAEEVSNAKPLSQLRAEKAALAAAEEAARVALEAEEARRDAAFFSSAMMDVTPQRGGKVVTDFDVTDIMALVKFDRMLVDITPKRQRILDHIAILEGRAQMLGSTDPVAIPGINITKVNKVSSRG